MLTYKVFTQRNIINFYLVIFQIYYFQVLVTLQSIHATNFVAGQFQLLKCPQIAVKYRDVCNSHKSSHVTSLQGQVLSQI